MIGIKANKNWKQLNKLMGPDVSLRVNWFLFEFGRKMTYMVHNELLGKISTIKGPLDYKKRLVVAEIRDKGGKAWWAIAATTKTLGQNEYDPERCVLHVVTRYELGDDNPINAILADYGPWTAQTIPFIPSLRQAVVVVRKALTDTVDEVARKNKREGAEVSALMDEFDLKFASRYDVYDKLKIVPDLAYEAMRLEFGLASGGKPHWRPAIAWGKRVAIPMLAKDGSLLRALTDPNFKGYRVRQHADYYMTPTEVKRLEAFERKLRAQMK